MNINNFNFIYAIIGLLILKMMTKCNLYKKDNFKRQISFKSVIGTNGTICLMVSHNDIISLIFEPKP